MTPEHQERLKKVAKIGIALAIGSVGVKIVKRGNLLGSAWHTPASDGFIIDLFKEGVHLTTRVSGAIKRGANGEIEDLEFIDRDYQNEEVEDLETVFSVEEEPSSN